MKLDGSAKHDANGVQRCLGNESGVNGRGNDVGWEMGDGRRLMGVGDVDSHLTPTHSEDGPTAGASHL
jgi:hypothetical protein